MNFRLKEICGFAFFVACVIIFSPFIALNALWELIREDWELRDFDGNKQAERERFCREMNAELKQFRRDMGAP